MKEFFQSPWVIGIITGVLSGILVFLISFWTSKAVEKKKHKSQIESANIEIIRTLRPYVSEKGLPPVEVLNAIINSSARKYLLKKEELYSVRIICEELTKEIIENIYVSSDKKSDFSVSLMNYIVEYEKLKLKTSAETDNSKKDRKAKNLFSDSISPMVISAVVVTVFVTALSVYLGVVSANIEPTTHEYISLNGKWIYIYFIYNSSI